jgi:monoamine oxidase
MSSQPHVGIIGAGFAGLRCADILIQNGAKVTILEARDRIGGRVCYYPFILAGFMENESNACIEGLWAKGYGTDRFIKMSWKVM